MKQARNVFKKPINHILLNNFLLKSNKNTSEIIKTRLFTTKILILDEKQAQINSGFYSDWDF